MKLLTSTSEVRISGLIPREYSNAGPIGSRRKHHDVPARSKARSSGEGRRLLDCVTSGRFDRRCDLQPANSIFKESNTICLHMNRPRVVGRRLHTGASCSNPNRPQCGVRLSLSLHARETASVLSMADPTNSVLPFMRCQCSIAEPLLSFVRIFFTG